MNRILLCGAIAAFVLTGCASQQSTLTDTYQQAPVEYQKGDLNRETLYQLLTAELAGQRQQFDDALNIYLEQAELTGDPGVAERATRIAKYRNNPDAFLKGAQLWIKAAPENPEPYQLAAGVLLHKGQFEQALPLLENALKADSKQALLLIASQSNKMNPQQLQGYEALLLRLQQQMPDNANLPLTRGMLLKQLDRNDEAMAAFNLALRLKHDMPQALVQKAELLRQKRLYKTAIEVLSPMIKGEQHPKQIGILYTQLLYQDGQKKAATEEARILLSQYPDEHQLKYYLSLLLLDNGELDMSREVLEELLEQAPDNPAPHFYLGHIAQQQKRKGDAIKHYQQVSEGTNLLPAYRRMISLLDSADDREQVEQILNDGRARHPQLSTRFYTVQAEWLDLHDFQEDALSLLEEALALHQDDPVLLYMRAMLVDPVDLPQMERDLRRVIELEPKHADAMNALGYTLTIYTERYQEAYDLIARALQLSPENPAILDSMGWILFKLEKYDEAINYLQQAYEMFPDAEVASHLIQAYWATGQQNRARELLNRTLREDPENEHLKQAAQAIGSGE